MLLTFAGYDKSSDKSSDKMHKYLPFEKEEVSNKQREDLVHKNSDFNKLVLRNSFGMRKIYLYLSSHSVQTWSDMIKHAISVGNTNP